MLQRSITGLIFLIVMLAGVLTHPITYATLITFITVGCLWEYGGLVWSENPMKRFRQVLIAGIGLFYCILHSIGLMNTGFMGGMAEVLILMGFSIILVFLLFIIELFLKDTNPFQQVGLQILGIIYIVLPFGIALAIGIDKQPSPEEDNWGNILIFTPQALLGILLLIWTNDVFAYLTGKFLGKHKLFERISPKKTWEGSIGGFLATIGMAYLLAMMMPSWGYDKLLPMNWLVAGILCSVFGSLGDLVESMLKRSLGIKDSGNLLPGHGGLLDRFDALIFALPFVGIYILI
jgi:phosphatidate cytidylyltransferase